MDNTKIEWSDATWSPTSGCTKITDGCHNCYAEKLHERFHGRGSFAQVTLHPERLEVPRRWRKPRRVFVDSMADLFHADVPDDYLALVFAVMAATPRHTYQILTKRHGRLRSLLNSPRFHEAVMDEVHDSLDLDLDASDWVNRRPWPLDNVWVGVSVEDQKAADLRIPALLGTPAAVRFLSCEPLLGPVNLSEHLQLTPCVPEPGVIGFTGLEWVIVGGESGSGARRMEIGWARSLVSQCRDAGVACFVKQMGSRWASENGWGGKGGLPEQWPAELRVREFPDDVPVTAGA